MARYICDFTKTGANCISIWQWSFGQEVEIIGDNITAGMTVQWDYPGITGVDSRTITADGTDLYAVIPNDALEQAEKFVGYIYYTSGTVGETRYVINVDVMERAASTEVGSTDTIPSVLVDIEDEDFSHETGDGTMLNGRLDKWEQRQIDSEDAVEDITSTKVSGTTDQTTVLESNISTYGHALIGNGTVYASALEVPDNGQLSGLGFSSVLRKVSGSVDKSLVNLNSMGLVKDIKLIGSANTTQPTTYDDVDGLLIDGVGKRRNIINNVISQGFTGSAFRTNANGTPTYGAMMSNCFAMYSGVGFNIDEESEYNQVSNCNAVDCYIGAQNNGGNNQFNNCVFSSCGIGFQIIGTDHYNHGHGSASNCFFKHSDLFAVRIIDCTSTFNFNGCHFQSNTGGTTIYLKDSDGIIFTGGRFESGAVIVIDGGGLVQFNGCVFATAPTFYINDNATVFLNDCYLPDGTEVTLPVATGDVVLFINGIYLTNSQEMTSGMLSDYTYVPLSDGGNHQLFDIVDASSVLGYKSGIVSITAIDITPFATLWVEMEDESSTSGGIMAGFWSSLAEGTTVFEFRESSTSTITDHKIELDCTARDTTSYVVFYAYTSDTGAGRTTGKIKKIWLEAI